MANLAEGVGGNVIQVKVAEVVLVALARIDVQLFPRLSLRCGCDQSAVVRMALKRKGRKVKGRVSPYRSIPPPTHCPHSHKQSRHHAYNPLRHTSIHEHHHRCAMIIRTSIPSPGTPLPKRHWD